MTTGVEPRLTEVIIDGVDVSDYTRSWNYVDELNETITSISINLSKRVEIDSVLTINDSELVGSTVTVKRGETTADEEFVFEGEVRDIDFTNAEAVIIAKDKLFNAVRSEVTKSYDAQIDASAGVISEIFKDMYNTYTDLTASASSVQDSGTINTISKFILNHADVFASGQELASAIDWQQYYNPNTGLVYFEPKGFVNNSDVLEVGDNITIPPKWKYDSSRLTNKLTVIGAEQLIETNENFSGDAAEDTFTLSFTPFSVKVFVNDSKDYSSVEPTDADLQTGGDEGTSGTFDYTVDADNNQIVFESGSIPGSGTNNIRVQYSRKLPIPVIGTNNSSVSSYGLHQKTIFRADLVKQADAEEFLSTYLSRYSTPFKNAVIRASRVTNMAAGQLIRVIDDDNGIDEFLLISKIRKRYPYVEDEVTVGDEAWKTAEWFNNINKRVRKLEEEFGKSQDLLLHVIDLNRNIRFERRYMEMQKANIAGNVLIWGSSTFGIWGEYNWGSTSNQSFILGNSSAGILGTSELGSQTSEGVTKAIRQGQNKYKEFVYDNDFFDTTNTTADIDLNNNIITF